MVWYFIGVYIINRTLHGHLEIRNFSSRVEKIFNEWAQRISEIFFNIQKEKFRISAWPCNILYLCRTDHSSMGWNISSPVHNLNDKAVLDCCVTSSTRDVEADRWLMGGSGVNGLKVVNLLVLLNSKTIEVLTQHLLAFLRPSRSIWQRLEWGENKLFWLAGKCFRWWCNCIQIVGPDRWKRVSQPLNCEYFHSVINFILENAEKQIVPHERTSKEVSFEKFRPNNFFHMLQS